MYQNNASAVDKEDREFGAWADDLGAEIVDSQDELLAVDEFSEALHMHF